MTDKIVNITNALTNLERQYVEHKEKFEKWKIDNVKQRGTETYNTYVERFHQWEMGVKEQQRQLIEERNNLNSSSDIDVAIDSLLSRLSMKDFVLAVVTMTSKDASFFPALLSAFKTIHINETSSHAPPYRSYAPTTYSPAIAHSYNQQYISPNIPSASHLYAPPVRRDAASVGNMAGVKRSYESIAATASQQITTPNAAALNDAWKMEEPSRKTYRPPSPIKDYRNPSTITFRDFSQAS